MSERTQGRPNVEHPNIQQSITLSYEAVAVPMVPMIDHHSNYEKTIPSV